MPRKQNRLLSFVTLLALTTSLPAAIIPDALLAFPAQTEYLEYDNLASLRTLPNYPALRQRFAGKPLEETKTVFAQLGIPEDQIQQMVVGSATSDLYGLVSGTFSGDYIAHQARTRRFAVKLAATEAYCTGRATCILFLEDSLAAFGSRADLKRILDSRQGVIPRLSSRQSVVILLAKADPNAPVRGLLLGAQLKSAISGMLEDWSGWKRDWSPFSANITVIGYSVRFDTKAHLTATVDCASKSSAAVLVQMLRTVGALQSVSNSTNTAPLENLHVFATGNQVDLKADTQIDSLK